MFAEIKPQKGSVKKRVRQGRGNASGLGGEGGRGHKGAKARSGYSKKMGFEGGQTPLYRRVPKKKGFKNINKQVYEIINLTTLEAIVKSGDIVNLDYLKNKNILSRNSQKVKLLGNGDLTKTISIEINAISKSAHDKLQKLGSSVKLIK